MQLTTGHTITTKSSDVVKPGARANPTTPSTTCIYPTDSHMTCIPHSMHLGLKSYEA
jgi:hypothetical protein